MNVIMMVSNKDNKGAIKYPLRETSRTSKG